MRGRGRDNHNNSSISNRQVVPYEDEDGDLDEEAGSDPAMLAWIAASNSGRGRGGGGGGGGSGSGGSDISVRSSRSLGRGMSGSHHRFGHHRERSAKFRRVKPLPLEESEDARERGVPVPAVGLPELIQRRMDAEAAAYAAIYSSNNSDNNTPTTNNDNNNVSAEDDGPSLTTAKKSYIAAQLKQLAQVVSFSSSTSANTNNSARGPAFSPSHLLPSPATAGSIGSNNRTAAPSPAAFSPFHHGRSTDGSPLAQTSPLGFSVGEQQQLRSFRNPPHPSRPPRGGNLGFGPAAVAGAAQGPAATSPPPARPLSAGAAETEATTSSIASFLVAQLDGLSQLLLDEENAAPNTATAVSSPTLSSSGGAATNRRGSGGSGGSRGSGAGPQNGTNTDGSLKYSPSAASSSSLLSRVSSLFDLEEGEEGEQSALPPPTILDTNAGNSRNNNGHDDNYGRNGDGDGAGGADGVGGVGGVGVGDGGVGVGVGVGGGGGENFVIEVPGESKSSRAPFDGGGGGGGGGNMTAREIPEGQQLAALPLTGGRHDNGERKKGSLSPPAASNIDARSPHLPGKPKPSPFSGDLASPPISDDDSKWDEEAGKARVEVESDDTTRRRVSRDTADDVGTGAVGRARLWRQMLEMESRAASMLGNIVAENAGALDQGLVLPCAPNDEEKVIYHKTGKGFLVTMGVLSLAALSAGMWLFTLAAPYFFWFGVPTTFLMGYLLLSYFGVAVWGKNFDPKEHEKTLRKARENRYYPSVDIFLPVCCEPTHLLDNTWKHVATLDYPNVTVHVLDDGAKEEVRQLARLHGFNYIRRDNRPELKKAGNLRYAFNRTRGEIIVIFDADFCPRPEFLRETTPYFAEEDVAILQTPQFFRCREEQTWVERGAGVTQELFYRMVQVNRDKFDAAICVGTCGVYRRAALAPFGGTAAIGYSEDVHTGFNCTQLGYKVKYIPQVMAMGTCPDEPRAFFMQQYRWCMGSTTLLCNKDFWRSNLTHMQKLCYISGMFYYSATAMAIFTGPMPGMLLIWFKPSSVLWFNISFAVPSIFFSVIVMRIWAKQRFDFSCQRVKVIQSFSHLYAIKDRIMKTAVPWVPTGGGASSRSSSQAYDSSVKLMLCWTTATTLLTIGGAAWRIGEFPWYHFLPTILLTTFNLALHLSTLL